MPRPFKFTSRPGYVPPFMPVVIRNSTAFERLLYEAGVKLEDAHKHPAIRQWIHSNYRHKWVPDKVLEAVGIRPEDIS